MNIGQTMFRVWTCDGQIHIIRGKLIGEYEDHVLVDWNPEDGIPAHEEYENFEILKKDGKSALPHARAFGTILEAMQDALRESISHKTETIIKCGEAICEKEALEEWLNNEEEEDDVIIQTRLRKKLHARKRHK